MKKKLVSVVMIAFNAEKFIKEAIDSILGQTYKQLELIIVNDGSTDNTASVINTYKDARIKFINRKKNMGIAYSRQEGIDKCTGEFFCFADADDIAVPDRLEFCVNYLKNHDCIAVCGQLQEMTYDGKLLNRYSNIYYNHKYLKARMMYVNAISNCAVCARMKIIKKVPIRKELLYGEDYRFWYDVMNLGKFVQVNKIMYLYRQHSDSITSVSGDWVKMKAVSSTLSYIRRKLGLILEIDDEAVIDRVLYTGKVNSLTEAKKVFAIMHSIYSQIKKLDIDEKEEMLMATRKRYGEIVGNSNLLWDGDAEWQ